MTNKDIIRGVICSHSRELIEVLSECILLCTRPEISSIIDQIVRKIGDYSTCAVLRIDGIQIDTILIGDMIKDPAGVVTKCGHPVCRVGNNNTILNNKVSRITILVKQAQISHPFTF